MFQNAELDPTALPTVEGVSFYPISHNYYRVDLYGTLILFGVLLIILGCIYYFAELYANGLWSWLLPTIYLSALIFTLFLVHKRYRMIGYALRERDIIFKSGIFWQKQTVLPFNRVQHVEIEEGPVERSFHLATLKIFTAGGESSDLSIPGLPRERATQMKDYIAEKTSTDV